MASRVSRGHLVVPNENLHICHKKPIVDESTDSLKTNAKKGSARFGIRKALNDITNKSSLSHDVSSKKNNMPKVELNVAEERFLHDHRKCIEVQQTVLDTFLLDLVLPGRGADTLTTDVRPEFNNAKEPEELPISEFSEWLEPFWDSPPSSSLHLDSPPSSPFAWHFETVEFTLRPGDGDA